MSDVVAVLEKRGRFLVGVPLFPRRESLPPGERQRGRGQLTVDGRRNGRPGQLVLLRVQGQGRGHARIVRTLGRPEVARDVIEGLMLDRELRRSFEPHVEREAREAAQRADTHPRRDLRGLPTFTIDPISARDFDDAISARADEAEGTTRVWVHIADVAAFVREGTALDREAHRRATSVYVPGAVEPMLPDVLSGDACSLRPGQDRLAVTVELSFRAEQVLSASIYRSVIRSDERLDYERVDRLFAGRERPRAPWGEPLQAARAVAAALDEARRRGAALTLEQPESEFELDEEGHVTAVRPRAQTESHRLIEHLMIAANEAVARLLRDRSAPCLYRVHERPDPERVERLVEQLASLEIPTPPLVEHLSSSQAADAVGEASRLVAAFVHRTGRGERAFPTLVLRSLKQAYYSPRNLGHAGLHSTAYCHFTSPIRRYPDLICHRAVLAAVGAGETAPRASGMAELGAWTSERERGAMVIERDADDVARCFALECALREGDWQRPFEGEVTGVIGAGAFVAFGPRHEYEGMLPVRRLRGETPFGARSWWELNEPGTILHGTRGGGAIRLGDDAQVRVHRIDAVRGRVDLDPA